MFSRESAVSAGLRCSPSLPGDAGADHTIIRGRERGRQTDRGRDRDRRTETETETERERDWGEGREGERGRSVEKGEAERGGGRGRERGRLGEGGGDKGERPIGRELRDMFSRQNTVSAGLRCSLALPGDAGRRTAQSRGNCTFTREHIPQLGPSFGKLLSLFSHPICR